MSILVASLLIQGQASALNRQLTSNLVATCQSLEMIKQTANGKLKEKTVNHIYIFFSLSFILFVFFFFFVNIVKMALITQA